MLNKNVDFNINEVIIDQRGSGYKAEPTPVQPDKKSFNHSGCRVIRTERTTILSRRWGAET